MSIVQGDPNTTFLSGGKEYTFSFAVNSVIPSPSEADLTASLSALGIGSVSSVCNPITNGFIDVHVYTGTVTTIQVYAETIINIWNALYPGFDVALSQVSDSRTDGLACGKGTDTLSNVKWILIAAVAGLALIAFFTSGGPGIIRGITGGLRK